MQAYQVVKYGAPLVLQEVPIPTPGPYEVLAKTLVTGVCHTEKPFNEGAKRIEVGVLCQMWAAKLRASNFLLLDVHVINGDLGDLTLPLTPGHEGIGIVTAIGSKVTSVKVGDRVGAPWLGESCEKCQLCKSGRENLCELQRQTGFVREGSFAEYFVVHEKFLGKIPNNVSDVEAAPILCAGLTAYRALKMAAVKSGDRIVISGACGGLGHLAIQLAKGLGLEVIALDMFNKAKREMISHLGADFAVDISNKAVPLTCQIKSLPGGEEKPISAVVIFAPVLSAYSDAVEYASPGATLVAVGLPKGSIQVDIVKFILKELKLQGSIVGSPRDLQEALELVAKGQIKANVTVRPFEAVNEVLFDLEHGQVSGRCVLQISTTTSTTTTASSVN